MAIFDLSKARLWLRAIRKLGSHFSWNINDKHEIKKQIMGGDGKE